MDYRILGPLEIRARDRLVPLRGIHQRELLAVLLLRANEIVSSDRLIDELWEGDPPATAAKMIQNGVSQLRKLIEPDVLVTRSPGYLLVVEPSELDADRFQRIVDKARSDLGAGEAAQAAEALREALGQRHRAFGVTPRGVQVARQVRRRGAGDGRRREAAGRARA